LGGFNFTYNFAFYISIYFNLDVNNNPIKSMKNILKKKVYERYSHVLH